MYIICDRSKPRIEKVVLYVITPKIDVRIPRNVKAIELVVMCFVNIISINIYHIKIELIKIYSS